MQKLLAQNRKHDFLVNVLPLQAVVKVHDHFVSPHPELPYDRVKEALISRMVASGRKRLQELFSIEEVEDHLPSQFLRNLQRLLGDEQAGLDTIILRELFLKRLPTTARCCLALSHDLPLTELSDLANGIMEAT